MITPLTPSKARQESAGERLLVEVVRVLEGFGTLHLVSRGGLDNQRALKRGDVPDHTIIESRPRPLRDRLGRALTIRPLIEPDELSGVSALRAARVIDLQWESNALLLRPLRRLNPRAQLVVTLHDVLSQRFERQRNRSRGKLRRSVWNVRRLAALALEAHLVRAADHVVVLSEKDEHLLPRHRRRAQVHVVPPPIFGELRPPRPREHSAPPTLLFVGFMARWDNQDAVRWLAEEILPVVRGSFSDVRLLVAGGEAPASVIQEFSALGVEMLGFVDDLEPLYAEAAATVVPLRYGAGVKFKVLDSLVRGIPTVTTTVGNEGINPPDAAIVRDDPSELAEAVIEILTDPEAAESQARAMAVTVAEEFGPDRFRRRLREVYL